MRTGSPTTAVAFLVAASWGTVRQASVITTTIVTGTCTSTGKIYGRLSCCLFSVYLSLNMASRDRNSYFSKGNYTFQMVQLHMQVVFKVFQTRGRRVVITRVER